jgi:hypothetical protein
MEMANSQKPARMAVRPSEPDSPTAFPTMNSVSPITEFVREVRRRFRFAEPESFWTCESSYLSLLGTAYITDLVNQDLNSLVRDPYYKGDWQSSELVLHRDPSWTLSIVRVKEPLRYIHALPFFALFSQVGPGDLSHSRYPLPSGYQNSVFDPSLKLEAPEAVAVQKGEAVLLRADRYAYDFHIPRPTMVLKFATAPLMPLEWLFSRDTLHPWQANDSDLSFTQLRIAAHLLGRFAHQSSLEPLKRLSAHSHHAVRWAAIQSLGRINRSEAMARLEEAVRDEHPHIQRAATKTLAQLRSKG